MELEELLLIVKAKSEALGLRLNVSKTKIMIVGSDGNEDPIVVDGTEVEHVTQFNFLGSLITTSSAYSRELRRRMAMAKSAMVGLNKIWTDRGITKATKKRLVSALIFPIATYGCESWTLTKADQSRITSFEMWCWRRMLRISWYMKRSNISVLEEIQPRFQRKNGAQLGLDDMTCKVRPAENQRSLIAAHDFASFSVRFTYFDTDRIVLTVLIDVRN